MSKTLGQKLYEARNAKMNAMFMPSWYLLPDAKQEEWKKYARTKAGKDELSFYTTPNIKKKLRYINRPNVEETNAQ